MDFLAYGSPSLDNIRSIFQAVAALAADDGMMFLPETVQTAEIREDAFYSGIRVTMEGRLGKASVPLQIDIGFGDDVTPAPAETEYPTLLPMPAPVLRVYPRETVIAEEFHCGFPASYVVSHIRCVMLRGRLCGEFVEEPR
jgi:hypothetical protein